MESVGSRDKAERFLKITNEIIIMPPKSSKCGFCVKQVSDKEQGIQCEICNKWYHCACQGINDKLYSAISEFEKDIHWFCKACRDGADKILAVVVQIQSRVDQLGNDMFKLRNDVRDELSQINKINQQELTLMRQQLSNVEKNLLTRIGVVENESACLKSEVSSKCCKLDSDINNMKDSITHSLDDRLADINNQTRVKSMDSIPQHDVVTL